MRTITIRLTDTEAWALDRLAGVNGLSKNKQIVNLIVKAYGEIDEGADIVEDDVISITEGLCWAKFTENDLNNIDAITKKAIATDIKIIRYVLENECSNAEDADIAYIEDLRDELLHAYREA